MNIDETNHSRTSVSLDSSPTQQKVKWEKPELMSLSLAFTEHKKPGGNDGGPVPYHNS